MFSITVAVGGRAAFSVLSWTIRTISVGVVRAVWFGVRVGLIGSVLLNAAEVVGLALIVAGGAGAQLLLKVAHTHTVNTPEARVPRQASHQAAGPQYSCDNNRFRIQPNRFQVDPARSLGLLSQRANTDQMPWKAEAAKSTITFLQAVIDMPRLRTLSFPVLLGCIVATVGLRGDPPSKPLAFREARLQVTGYDHNRPDSFPGLGDFIGWAEAIARMPNGDLLVAHSAGYWHASFASPRLFPPDLRKHWGSEGWPLDFEAPTGGRSMACRSTDGGKTWSKPYVMIDYRLDDRPHSLFTCRDGTVLCFINVQASWYGFEKAPAQFANDEDLGSLNGQQFVIRSIDNGKTWSKPIWIKGPGLFYERAHGPPIQLVDGGLLWATYNRGHPSGRKDLFGAIHRSDDSGKTWRVISQILRKDVGNNIDEPAIVQLKDGRIIMVTRKDGGVLYSADDGRTWTEPGIRVTTKPLKFKAPQVLLLKDGTLVVVATLGTLRVWVSKDHGATWSDDIPLDPSCYGYPGAALLNDESIVVSYCERGRAPNRVYVIRFRVNDTRDGIELLSLGDGNDGS